VFPFIASEPHAVNPSDEQFTVGTTDAYSATGRIVVDGEAKLAFDGVVTAPAESYAEYVLVRLTSDDPTIRRITFEFDPGGALDRPPWVSSTDVDSGRDRPGRRKVFAR
jgi:hypothetical protein